VPPNVLWMPEMMHLACVILTLLVHVSIYIYSYVEIICNKLFAVCDRDANDYCVRQLMTIADVLNALQAMGVCSGVGTTCANSVACSTAVQALNVSSNINSPCNYIE